MRRAPSKSRHIDFVLKCNADNRSCTAPAVSRTYTLAANPNPYPPYSECDNYVLETIPVCFVSAEQSF